MPLIAPGAGVAAGVRPAVSVTGGGCWATAGGEGVGSLTLGRSGAGVDSATDSEYKVEIELSASSHVEGFSTSHSKSGWLGVIGLGRLGFFSMAS